METVDCVGFTRFTHRLRQRVAVLRADCSVNWLTPLTLPTSRSQFTYPAGMGPRLIRALTAFQQPLFSLMRGRFQGPPTLRLITTGRRSGKPRSVLLLYLDEIESQGRLVVVASYGGHHEDPYWWKNLQARPQAEVWSAAHGAQQVSASEIEGEDREEVWERLISMYSPYQGYQAKTSRRIPLVALTPL